MVFFLGLAYLAACFAGPRGQTHMQGVAQANSWLSVSWDFATSVTKALKTFTDQELVAAMLKWLPTITLLGFSSTTILGMLVLIAVHSTSIIPAWLTNASWIAGLACHVGSDYVCHLAELKEVIPQQFLSHAGSKDKVPCAFCFCVGHENLQPALQLHSSMATAQLLDAAWTWTL